MPDESFSDEQHSVEAISQPEDSTEAMVLLELGNPAEPVGPWFTRFTWLLPGPGTVFGIIFVASLLLRILWLSVPRTSLIFDETYYVNAARIILGIHVPHGLPYSGMHPGIDPNHEHPPLGKVLIAGSMHVFGDNPLGWRFPSLVAGMLAILLLYGIVRAAGGQPWLAVLATVLFSFDNLVFVHSRIGTLDMMMLAFMLLAAWLALRRQPLLAAFAAALACLVKLEAIYGLLALIVLELIDLIRLRRQHGAWSFGPLRTCALLIVGFLPCWFLGLWLIDSHFGYYHNPFDHLHYMLQYGLDLTRPGGPQGQESDPWQWLINEVQMTYLRTDVNEMAGGKIIATWPTIYFRGAMNPLIIGALPFGVAFALWRAVTSEDRLALWATVWFAANYLPFYPLSMAEHRISYIFYFLPTLPAVAIGIAMFLRHGGIPRLVIWVYLLLVMVGFYGYFPYRTIPH